MRIFKLYLSIDLFNRIKLMSKFYGIPMFLADDMNIGHSGKMLYARLLLTYKE